MKEKWLIWSNEHRQWWAPSSNGYVSHRKAAGRYEFEQALVICREANMFVRDDECPNEAMVPE